MAEKNKLNKQEKIILILGIISILLICFIVYLGISLDNIKRDLEDTKYENNWACMDGCYNMLLVINNVSSFDYDDIGNKSLHDNCVGTCFKQYPIFTKSGER